MPRAAWLLLLLLPVGCGGPAAVQDVTGSDWTELIGARQEPTVVYVWASWSRESVELLPTILELEQEYEGRGVEFLYLSLDIDDAGRARSLMRRLGGPSFYRITTSLEQATAALGIGEPPAFIGYRRGAVQSAVEGDSLSPDSAEGLLERLLAEDL